MLRPLTLLDAVQAHDYLSNPEEMEGAWFPVHGGFHETWQYVKNLVEDTTVIALAYEVDGIVRGIVTFRAQSDMASYQIGYFVAASCRGSGLARHLVHYMNSFIHPSVVIVAKPHLTDTRACAFVKKLGFYRLGENFYR